MAQKEYATAEPLLLAGYEGMKERYDRIPPLAKARLVEAAASLADLYAGMNQPDKATIWRNKRDAEQKAMKMPK